jgi:hypothetical protein
MTIQLNQDAASEIRQRVMDAIGDEHYPRVKHLGDRVFLAQSSLASPFVMAVLIERAFGRIELVVDPAENEWKRAGIWSCACSYVRFTSFQPPFGDLYRDVPDLPPAPTNDYVYFVGAPGMVKIGRSRNPHDRLVGLRSGIPLPLELLAVLPDGSQERELHERFAHLRLKGEWFRREAELEEFIADLRRQTAEAQAKGKPLAEGGARCP